MAMSRCESELLTKHESDFIATLDLHYLQPHLTKCGLLTTNDVDVLTKSELTRQDSIKKFLTILKTKGNMAFSLFIKALYDEREHLGHASLYKVLTTPEIDPQAQNRLELYMQDEPCLSRTGISHSSSANSLRSGSEISRFSSSAAASSICSEALSNEFTSVHSELSSIKKQLVDNTEMISELTNNTKRLTDHFEKMSERTNELKGINVKTSSSKVSNALLKRRHTLATMKSSSFDTSLIQACNASKQNTQPIKGIQNTIYPLPVAAKKVTLNM